MHSSYRSFSSTFPKQQRQSAKGGCSNEGQLLVEDSGDSVKKRDVGGAEGGQASTYSRMPVWGGVSRRVLRRQIIRTGFLEWYASCRSIADALASGSFGIQGGPCKVYDARGTLQIDFIFSNFLSNVTRCR